MRRKRKNRALFICPYPHNVAPSQRLKFEQYYSTFQEAGYNITHSSFITKAFWKIIYKRKRYLSKAFFTLIGYCRRSWDLLRIPFYDVVYIHLWVTPFGPPIFERLVRLLSRRIVYDIDDMIYLRDQKSKANPIVSNLKGKNKPIYLFKAADSVLTSTESIETYAKQFNNNTFYVPITIDTNAYRPKKSYQFPDKITLGWTGSQSTSPYLHLLDEVFLELRRSFDFKLVVMGDEGFQIDGIQVEAIPWKESYEVEVIRSFDIGLYPLPVNDWVLGKGGGKALQYMAVGVPAVVTNIGVNSQIITNGTNGFLVQTSEEWIMALKMLIQNEDLRARIGTNGVNTVESHFSVASNKEKYLKILNGF